MPEFFALTLLGACAALVAALFARPLRTFIENTALPLAAIVATGATLGSLYFSEVREFVPCELCWFQRIAMYPLAPILAVAAVRDDNEIGRYVLPLSAIGGLVSLYHVQLQLFPDQSSTCSPTAPCSSKWVEALGWMTIPQMAALSFAIITVLVSVSLRQQLARTGPRV